MAQQKKSMIIGRHPVVEAIKTGQAMDKLILQQGVRGDFEKEIRWLSKRYTIPLQVVPKERMNKFTRANHQGIIGLLSLLPYYRLEDLLPTIYEQSAVPLILLLDGITDVRNFGAIARSAECCGVHGIVIPKKGAAQINAEAIKTSAGALTKIPICRENSLSAAIDFLILSGIQVLATDLTASQAIQETDFTLPTAIVLGAEGEGVSPAILQTVAQNIIIPQVGTSNSFNVSVAAGIILYEVLRQRLVAV
ncbi:MAG: 23S rRNA (guanosine(2251)-2'-O)-methyltransferase RlmB [Bacteroidota bacterium]